MRSDTTAELARYSESHFREPGSPPPAALLEGQGQCALVCLFPRLWCQELILPRTRRQTGGGESDLLPGRLTANPGLLPLLEEEETKPEEPWS